MSRCSTAMESRHKGRTYFIQETSGGCKNIFAGWGSMDALTLLSE